jgi:PAS domain-containing protein
VDVQREPELAAWLVAERASIDRLLAARLGDAAPRPADPESEALRRFRSFAAAALQSGRAPQPSLDGLRASETRVFALLEAWCGAAQSHAGARGDAVARVLEPLLAIFRAALRETEPARRRSGAPRTGRRAVVAAIDRVGDAFLAVDVDARRIVDANPAAGALLASARDALLGAELRGFLPEGEHESWTCALDALAEAGDARRFHGALRDARGQRLEVEASLTRYARGGRLLALALLRPRPNA